MNKVSKVNKVNKVKPKSRQKTNRYFSLCSLLLVVFLGSCHYSKPNDYSQAKDALNQKRYSDAVNLFEKVIAREGRSPLGVDAALQAANIAYVELKDFKKASVLFKHLVLYSQDEAVRIEAQKKIASIYFLYLNDYSRAVIELNRLLELPRTEAEENSYRMSLARSYYHLNNFFQAEMEISSLLKRKVTEEESFEALLLQGNILVARKDLDLAVAHFQDLINKYPQKAAKEGVALNLAMCFEEKKDYNKAIQILEEMKKNYAMPQYLDLRIKRLKNRLGNLPGARGLRK
jgi:tetratricopeptide (TPR) repeat protein